MTRIRIAVGDERLLMEGDFPSGARPVVGDRIEVEIDSSRIGLIPDPPAGSV